MDEQFQDARAIDRIPGEIACLDIANLPATLISTAGSHCEVWQQAGGIVRNGQRTPFDVVIKKFRHPCSFPEARVYAREYRRLRDALEDIIPFTQFLYTRVDGHESVVVIAETFSPWFNIASPVNVSEAVPLLQRLTRAREQLKLFVRIAREWRHADDPKVIDLYGVDNLILDRNYNLRYIDSFGVFFYEDLLHILDGEDESLKSKIDISLRRLDYLDYLLEASGTNEA